MARKLDSINGETPGGGSKRSATPKPKRAFRTILQWIGEDPDRDGLRETPHRLVRSFREYFCGYDEDPAQVLSKTFSEVDGYDEMIVLRGVTFESHCEHHVAPIIGRAWVGYIPDRRVVGISKLARVVEIFSRRLQIQERLTAQIANAIDERAEAQRRRGGDQGRAPLHDQPRRPQARLGPRHQPHARRLPRPADDPERVPVAGQRGHHRVRNRFAMFLLAGKSIRFPTGLLFRPAITNILIF